ncbi:unnamed protein product [Peronospora belbahrii]|uniref:Uncharacterized protein n=1 Tax=Peronospora belbahrii TaxID=622444 RepID=A0AAU9KM23_9STRA|nr:unnamed protein product [Peronospora belbahrii]CAH0515603.1 unnamed protein product [Peronospora belbahrii]
MSTASVPTRRTSTRWEPRRAQVDSSTAPKDRSRSGTNYWQKTPPMAPNMPNHLAPLTIDSPASGTLTPAALTPSSGGYQCYEELVVHEPVTVPPALSSKDTAGSSLT